MTTGAGIAIFGVWFCAATMWHSEKVHGAACLVMTAVALVATMLIR